MPNCPDCGNSYTHGQVICEECGCDLSPIEVKVPKVKVADDAPTKTVSVADAPEYYCDPNQLVDGINGCGYVGTMVGNICPKCGGLWENPIPALPAHKTTASTVTQSQPVNTDLSLAKPVEPSSHIDDDYPESTAASYPMLVVEGNQTVLYEGGSVSEIPFDVDELSIGCRDTEQGHYPDIDLLKYRNHDPFLSRQHALFFKEDGKYFINVLSQADSTGFNSKSDIMAAGERREIKTGTRIFFSDSIVITLK